MGKKNNIVLVVDSGGRGSVLVDKYLQSRHVAKVIAVPGNDLMLINTRKPVQIYPQLKTTSIPEILEICMKENVSLVDVAQDNAVEAGLVDALIKKGIRVIGPTKLAGQIEWDKAWAREFGEQHNIPQPVFKICYSQKEGFDYLKSQPDQPWFIKASGLAEGKGALPADNNKEAMKMVKEMTRFGKNGKTFLIEKWLRSENNESAEEFSMFVVCDGEHFKIIGSAQDHKRVNNFDRGENTGGMGCVSSPLVLTPQIKKEIKTKILKPTIKGLKEEGRPYKGILYLGGIIVKQNGRLCPYVIEFNARWGDPEAEVILPGITNDLFEMDMSVLEGNIDKLNIQADGKSRVVIAGVSKGYPSNYENIKGKQIFGLDKARKIKGIHLYGASVKVVDKKYYVHGGRLFYIVGEGRSIIEARRKAYEAMSLIHIDGNNLHYRTDIGWRDVQRLQK
jgi:phosphoribosylamine--glycine ligase